MANTLKDELTNIIENEQPIADNKVANFGYEDTALADPQTYADGVTDYDFERPNNIPVATAETLKVNETILTKGFRSQASSVTRMLVNHFFGRVSYNLNKTVELVQRFFTQFKAYMGAPNGIATLDANGRVPASQLPETALEYQGNWNASTNEITNHTLGYDSLINGTGTKGDLFLCEVEGWFNASTGECSATKPEPSTGYVQYFVNDRVIYDGASWNRLSSGDIKKVNGLSPVDGNVQLTHKLTLAQYNALTSLERQGKLFVITDIEGVDMFIINDNSVGTDTVWSSSKTKTEFDSINNKIPSTATSSNKLVDTAQLNGALSDYQKTANYLFASNTPLSKDSLCDSLGLSKQSGAVLLAISSRNIYANGVQLAFMYWFDNNEVGLTNVYATNGYSLVEIQNGSIIGRENIFGFRYTIALSVIGVIPTYY